MSFWKCCVSIVAAISMASCTTTLQTGKANKDTGGIATKGVAYHLPDLVYAVQVTRVLTACPKPGRYSIDFDVAADAKDSMRAGQPIFIDYEGLVSGTKTADMTFALHPNGMLSSVNVAVKDHTAELVTEGVKAAVSIAKMAIGVPSVPVSGGAKFVEKAPEPFATIECTEDTRKLVEAVAKLKEDVKLRAQALKAATKKVEDFETVHLNENPRLDDTKVTSAELFTSRLEAQEGLNDANEALAKVLGQLTLISRTSFVPGTTPGSVNKIAHARDGSVSAQDLFVLVVSGPGMPKATVPFASGLQPDERRANFKTEGDASGAFAQFRAKFPEVVQGAVGKLTESSNVAYASKALVGSAAPDLTAGTSCNNTPADNDGVVCGIIYYTYATGQFQICRDPKGNTPFTAESCISLPQGDAGILFRAERAMPQLGTKATLPFHNGAFSDNTLAAEFRDDGTLIKAQYKKPVAETVAAVGSLNVGLQGAQSIIDAQKAAGQQPAEITGVKDEAALLGAQTEKVKKEIELLKAQRELESLKSTPDVQ